MIFPGGRSVALRRPYQSVGLVGAALLLSSCVAAVRLAKSQSRWARRYDENKLHRSRTDTTTGAISPRRRSPRESTSRWTYEHGAPATGAQSHHHVVAPAADIPRTTAAAAKRITHRLAHLAQCDLGADRSAARGDPIEVGRRCALGGRDLVGYLREVAVPKLRRVVIAALWRPGWEYVDRDAVGYVG